MAPIERSDDPRLTELVLLMDEAGYNASFRELDPFGERHGSWQRTLHALADGLDRYVIAAVTSLEDGDEVAVMAGAEERADNDLARLKFRRFDVGSLRVSSSTPFWPTGDLRKLLDQAVRMAVEIQPLQLEEMQLLAS
jgi:hypothetical protein